ncbi:MAG TPA: hypothetical protein VFR90_05470 [Methylibium sp.]|uniref:hypothetical protein n=1 Tax=Methylibium sp. TaxID=2067992 RepID=UPI002DB59669|nr:hypothetical protein [Methylibium sp.]HEU4458552.1 hypothetical protein [Methylibium sp.]
MLARASAPVAFALIAASIHAAGADPIDAPACRAALAALDREEAAARSRPRDEPAPPTLIDARRRAASDCLGSARDEPPPRSSAAPIAVPPIASPLPSPRSAPPRASAGPPPVLPAPAQQTITSCDALGCWTSTGSRLQRAGPNLLGPRGACSGPGPVVSCP